MVKDDICLSMVGDIDAQLPDVMAQTTRFLLACYGHRECDNEACQKMWAAKIKQNDCVYTQATIATTYYTEATHENVVTSHFEGLIAIWRLACDAPPVTCILNPIN